MEDWDFDPKYPVEDWQYEVANGDTREGYWDWVYNKKANEELEEEDEEEREPSLRPPRTEQERMRDFFFPKRRGSFLMNLKSWK